MSQFVEIQPYDSSHPIIINTRFIAEIEPASHGSNLWLINDAGGMRMIRTMVKYNNWCEILNAR